MNGESSVFMTKCLFQKQAQLEPRVFRGLLQVTIFVVRVYVQAWFSASISVTDPRNDLNFLKSQVDYELVQYIKKSRKQLRDDSWIKPGI